ncbi:hypothetical protein V5P93_003684 [Actinokineospora auranticolor]|uniref:Uncharacterized protein n=1 Tax=Actinokineospora auranticolor TaxID=155976 RepID=A0A2S6GJ57_9PSEU|nr:hypothetical protein [Actinokineospora auranticolor]PPK65247.1 hypothetical protein CLV40_11594 [Actinokineospora auranticolor]
MTTWTGYGWVAVPLALVGILVGGGVGAAFGHGTLIEVLVGAAAGVLVAGVAAYLLGRGVNRAGSPAERYWRNDHRMCGVPVQFAGCGYAVIGNTTVAQELGRARGAWLGWLELLVVTALIVLGTVWWGRSQRTSPAT